MARRGPRLLPQRTATTEYRAEPTAQFARMDATSSSWRPQRRKWQQDGWDHFETMGEVHYPLTVGSNLASKFDLRLEKQQNDGSWLPSTGNRTAMRALDAVLGCGLEGLLRGFYLNYGVAGEGFLLTDIADGRWMVEFVSMDEMERDEGDKGPRWWRRRYSALEGSYSGEREAHTGMVYRCWRPHPRYSGDPDSALRSVLVECKELQTLKLTLLARITSRLASMGILFLPNTLRAPAAQTGTQSGEDALVAYFTRLFTAAHQNDGKGAAAMPVIVAGPPEDGEKIRHVILDTALTDEESRYREELRAVIAQGIELPKQTQTSDTSDVNHWGMWQINENALMDHVAPIVRAAASMLTHYVLHPWMRAKGETAWDDWRFGIDATRASLSVVRTDAARQGYDRGLLGDEAFLRAHGFSDTDAPTTEQYLRWVGIKLNNPMLATWGIDDPELTPEVLTQGSLGGDVGPGGFDAPNPQATPENIPIPETGLDQS